MKRLEDYLYYEEKDPDLKIYHGDSLKIMPLLEKSELVVTDPHYNATNIGPNARNYEQGTLKTSEEDYAKFCSDWFTAAQNVSNGMVFTSGIANTHNYPKPRWQICWHKPASCSFNRLGGYNAWEPILVYGNVKGRIGQDYILMNTLNFTKGPEKNHPCPKPLALISWIVNGMSKIGQTVLDPFVGSGTTLVACKELNRNGIGIEINEKYCEISKQRLISTPKPMFLEQIDSKNSEENDLF